MARRRRGLRRLLATVAAICVAAAVVALVGPVPAVGGRRHGSGPGSPYAHGPLDERSVAGPVSVGGDTQRITDGLEAEGFFCAQVRSNARAAQSWCRHEERSALEPRVTLVQVVSTLTGDLVHARVDIDGTGLDGQPAPGEWMRRVVTASFLQAWPSDEADVTEAMDAAEYLGPWEEAQAYETPPVESAVTANAEYGFVGHGLDEMTAHTRLAAEAIWPYGADHYALTPSQALPGVLAGGSECYPPDHTSCWPGQTPAPPGGLPTMPDADGGLYLTFTTVDHANWPGDPVTPGDQITSAAFGVGAQVPVDGPPPTLAEEGFPVGLSFLTPQVEPAVRAQIEQCMATGTPFSGVVAGTVLVIDAERTQPHDGSFVTNCGVTIGVPLVQPWSTGA
jgi:hypothetical protein